jgi:hypothetical protein
MYQGYRNKKLEIKSLEVNRYIRRSGYGYIKRRVGLLSSEVEGPTCLIMRNH